MFLAKSKTNLSKQTQAQLPMPNDFAKYLTWAFSQFEGDGGLVIQKIKQSEYVNVGIERKKSKSKTKKNVPMSYSEEDDVSTSWTRKTVKSKRYVTILATYDSSDNLVALKFDRNLQIPRRIIKIMGMIIQYQPYMTAITINQGMDKFTLYELNKWLSISALTDICLDDTLVQEANYHILLSTPSSLKNLSLARCRIDDQVVKNLASGLTYPSPGAKKLAILNLASNRITDLGAVYLGEALRTNRKLYYLNLADNAITDDGASSLFDILKEFPLTCDEFSIMRSKYLVYLNEKRELSKQILRDLKAGDFEKRVSRRKLIRPLQPLGKKSKGMVDIIKSQANLDEMLLEKANVMAVAMLGLFDDPFSKTHTKMIDNVKYCLGNNVLCYLNLAYNNLSYLSVRKLLKVVETQKNNDRKPRGLVNICIEGNNIPMTCKELANIDGILEFGLKMQNSKSMSVEKRKRGVTTPNTK